MPVLENRHTFIGGSEIAAIMGLSRWGTPLSVWAKKTGNDTEEFVSNEAIEMGIRLEQTVAELFTEKSGIKVRRDSRDFEHTHYPYLKAHIDRWIIGGGVLECKTCTAFKDKEWSGDETPAEYFLQVNWYLGILGQKLGYIAVLIGGQKFIYKKVEFSQKLFDKQVKCAVDFWLDFVLPEIPPVAMGGDSDTLQMLLGDHSDEVRKIIGGDDELEFNDLMITRMEASAQIKEIEEEKDIAENKLRQLIGGDLGVESGQYKLTWKSQKTTRVDTQALRENGLYEVYSKTTVSRRLNFTQKKEG